MTQYGRAMCNLLNQTPALKPQWPFPGRELTLFDTVAGTLTTDKYFVAHVNSGDIITGGRVCWNLTTVAAGSTITLGDANNCARLVVASAVTANDNNLATFAGNCGSLVRVDGTNLGSIVMGG